jgi:hypothetical protein
VKGPKDGVEVVEVDEGESEDEEKIFSPDDHLARIYEAILAVNKMLAGLTAIAGRLLDYVTDTEERRILEAQSRWEEAEAEERDAGLGGARVGQAGTSTSGSGYSTLFVDTPFTD